jgi:hypothetical protein
MQREGYATPRFANERVQLWPDVASLHVMNIVNAIDRLTDAPYQCLIHRALSPTANQAKSV